MASEMPERIWTGEDERSGPYYDRPVTGGTEYILATTHTRAMEALAKAASEMSRYLPIIEAVERNPALWQRLTAGTGIATANGYRNAIAAAKGEKP